MKAILYVAVVGVLMTVPNTCFALWGIMPVTQENAKELGLSVSFTLAGPNHVIVELQFKPVDKLKDFSRVDLRVGNGDNPPVTAALREDRSKPDYVKVSLTANRDQIDQLSLWVMVPGLDGGTVYDLRVKDFVSVKPAPKK